MKHLVLTKILGIGLFLAFSLPAFAQFPNLSGKLVQGKQTTALGITSYSDTVPLHTPTAASWRNNTQIHRDTALGVDYVWRYPRWYASSTVRQSSPPPATRAAGSNFVDFTETLWQNSTDSLTYYYEEKQQCWQPVGTVVRDTTPVSTAATGTSAAVCYEYSLWYNSTNDSLYAYTAGDWLAIGSGGGGTVGAVDSIVVLQDSIIVGYSEGVEVTRDTIGYPAGSGTVTASNGLTKTGNDIALGGTLTGATTITGASQDFTETGLKYYQFEADSAIWRINGEKFLHMGSLKGASYNYDEVAIGYRAGANLPAYNSTANTLIGSYAGAALNGTGALGASNWMAGYTAGQLIQTGSYNTITGVAAMAGTSTAISFSGAYGHHTMRLATGDYNYGFGNNALENITGTGNFGAGQNALRAGLSANYNTGTGHQVMENLTTGDYNTADGENALRLITTGSQNTGAGGSSLYSNQTGSGNIGLGYRAGYNETGSNKLYIDNSDTSSPLIGGDLSGNFVGINQAISSLAYVLDINSTGAMRFPIGTTAQRPTTATGIFRVNSDSTRFEWYTGSTWKSFAHVGDAGGGGGSGTVTSVGLTMPTGFSVSGSPVTTSGTLAVTTSLSKIVRGDGSGLINSTLADDGTTVSMDDASAATAKPFRFDSWTTAARPTGAVGIAGNNTTANNYDFYTGSSWENFAKHTNATGLGTATYIPFYDSNGRLGAGNFGLSFITTSYPYLQYGQNTTLTDNAIYYWINGNASSRTFTNSSGSTRSGETGAWRCVALFAGANAFENGNGMTATVLASSGLAAGSTLRGGYFQASNGSGAGLATEIVGVRGDGSNASTSGTTTVYGGRFAGANNAAGTVTTTNIVSAELGGNSGTITNTRGFFCGDVTAGTQTNTAWSFYASDANANSAFNGKVRVGGVTVPSSTLDVTGSLGVSTLSGTGTQIGGWTSANVATTLTEGYGLNITSGALLVDTTQVATPADLSAYLPLTLTGTTEVNTAGQNFYMRDAGAYPFTFMNNNYWLAASSALTYIDIGSDPDTIKAISDKAIILNTNANITAIADTFSLTGQARVSGNVGIGDITNGDGITIAAYAAGNILTSVTIDGTGNGGILFDDGALTLSNNLAEVADTTTRTLGTGQQIYANGYAAYTGTGFSYSSGRITNASGASRICKIRYYFTAETAGLLTDALTVRVMIWDGATYTEHRAGRLTMTLNDDWELTGSKETIITLPDGDGVNIAFDSTDGLDVSNFGYVIEKI